MKINFDSKRELKELYQVGNVIENYGSDYLCNI